MQPLFFARQAGAFHLVVSSAYLIEYFRYRGVRVMLATKAIAVVFLGVTTAIGGVPWVVPVSGLVDAAMLALAWRVHARLVRGEPGGWLAG